MTKPNKASSLNHDDRKNLIDKFRITSKVEAAAQLCRLDDEGSRHIFGIGDPGDMSGIAFLGHDLLGVERGPYCVRLDDPPVKKNGEPNGKYRSLPGSADRYLYCLPEADKLKDSPVVIVESPKSVLAVASAAERAKRKVLAVATNGCWGWKQKTDDLESQPLADLDLLKDRDVVICLDSNVATKHQVTRAEKALAAHLLCRARARSVKCSRVPLAVNGPDDFIAANKDDRKFWQLIDAAREPWLLGDMFASYDELMKAPEPSFLIKGLLQDQGTTFIHGLSGHGKTMLLMSVMKALLTGKPLFGFKQFSIVRKVDRILYLSPEIQLGQARLRLKLFGLTDYVKNDQLLVRTLTEGPSPDLLDPDILMAARGAVVVIDTAVRFMEGKESAAEDNRDGLAAKCFRLTEAGALIVLGTHHSPKSFADARHMSLENMSRGSGDIGGMLSGAWGVAQVNTEQNIIHIENLKPRDQDPFAPFQVQGRPCINQQGDFQVSKPPGVCESYGSERPEPSKGGRPQDDDTKEKLDFIAGLGDGLTQQEIADKVNEKFKTNHRKGTIGKWLRVSKRKCKP